ncbi:MAG: 5'-nucleotidase, lipoprotein e(P4) family [Candidatus Cloacimonetes bacterium]|nr:5'-nucleotidase, lipoprotein e(P4) family [Candidatus Cloacimonadota bacterium]MCF7813958.1 5'-nucleotidase, lipoprotein e(P4) family [Candidatus Cloacimonadota bacterium]MCF7868802.1 5'-nucleotidase, lipoprotein e(P4) family [Candidatus Cloacimonadota bacterium]MCF7884061.1 5'-nucleotidase, lipoprotein e(P4) family [Candidatus Cloacimonadota bacterium]
MNRLYLISLILLVVFCLFSQDAIQTKKAETIKFYNQEILYPVLWQKTSAEYKALAYQAYNLATFRLSVALQKTFPKPLAVVVDLDETVLDNMEFEILSILENKSYSKHFAEWNENNNSRLVPGALEFLNYANKNDVEIFYITNRDEDKHFDGTLKNLKELNLPFADKEHLFMRTTTSSKQPRRNMVSENFHIALFIGDNLIDFSDVFRQKTIEQRAFLADSLKTEFGRKFIVLPNPVYGEWIKTIYQYKRDLSENERFLLEKEALLK